MEFKDYYKTMGVSPEATPEEIKRAYRVLARTYHPDVSKEKDAEARFKEVGEAYDVLKDAEKRKAYDRLRQGGWQAGQDFTPPPGWQYQRSQQSQEFSPEDTAAFSDFFESLFGGGGRSAGGFGGFQRQRTQQQRGQDLQYALTIPLEEAFAGGQRLIQLRVPEIDSHNRASEKTVSLNVKIPAGITEGQQIRLAGQGAPGMYGGPAGDLYLTIHIAPNSLYHLQGRDITLQLPITPWEAALGATIETPSLAGQVALKIPANSESGQKLRLKGRGLPGNPAGDQYVVLQIVTPPANSDKAKQLYEQMAKEMPFNPRHKLGV